MVDRFPGTAFVAMLFFTAFALTSFYSLLLPRFIDRSPGKSGSLARYYATELSGAVVGIIVVFMLGSISWIQPVLYQFALATVVAFIFQDRRTWALVLTVAVIYAALFKTLHLQSLSYHYTHFHHLPGARILYSVYSPYQKVDIVESGEGNRYIYLDGRKNYGNTSLKMFNIFLSQFPARLLKPDNALALGAGSMESVKYIGSVAKKLRVVDLDEAVPNGSRQFFKYTNHIDEYDNWTLTIDDAKSFLRSTDELFDLITVDIPAPLQIQTGLLHSVEFYELIKEHLSPHGAVSISLSGNFKHRNFTPRTVAAALTTVFEDVFIHTPDIAGRSFAIAGKSLPFTKADLEKEARNLGAEEIAIFNKNQALNIIDGLPPITYSNLSYPLKRSIRRIRLSYFSSGD